MFRFALGDPLGRLVVTGCTCRDTRLTSTPSFVEKNRVPVEANETRARAKATTDVVIMLVKLFTESSSYLTVLSRHGIGLSIL